MAGKESENILAVFIEEARGIVVQLGEQLDELHYGYDGQRILDDIHRGFHTLKGGAAVMGGLEPLVECSGLAEQVLDRLRTKQMALNPGLVSLITRDLHAVESMLEAASRGQPIEAIPEELRERLLRASGREQSEASDYERFGGSRSAGESENAKANDPLDLFFGDHRDESDRGNVSTPEGQSGITDDEFESLLDELHGEGRGPTRLPGSEPDVRERGRGASDELTTGSASAADKERMRMDQMKNLVTELSWVRSRLMRLSSLRSREDLGKALSYLDLVTRDMQRWVRELDDDQR